MYPHLKAIQVFFKVFNHHGYIVGRCSEQFSEQVLLSDLLCCQKTLDSTMGLTDLLLFLRTNLCAIQSKLGPFYESSDQGLSGSQPQNKPLF